MCYMCQEGNNKRRREVKRDGKQAEGDLNSNPIRIFLLFYSKLGFASSQFSLLNEMDSSFHKWECVLPKGKHTTLLTSKLFTDFYRRTCFLENNINFLFLIIISYLVQLLQKPCFINTKISSRPKGRQLIALRSAVRK